MGSVDGADVAASSWRAPVAAPYLRVTLVTFLLLGFGVLFLVLTLRWIDEVAEPVDIADSQLNPAREKLLQTDQGLSRSQYLFDRAVLEPDPSERVAFIEALRSQLSLNEEAWRGFLDRRLGFAGEDELIEQFEDAADAQQRLVGDVGYELVVSEDSGALLANSDLAALLSFQNASQVAVQELLNEIYEPRLADELARAEGAAADASSRLLAVFAGMALVALVLAVVGIRASVRHDRGQRKEHARRAAEARRNEFEARLYRALQMATTETFAYEVIAQALRETLPSAQAELLVADGSDAPFRRALRTDQRDRGSGCRVGGPAGCPSAQRGDRLVFTSATDLDACPYLRERAPEEGRLSAVCQPVAIAGRSLGVIHATTGDGIPSDEAMGSLDLIGRRSGDRIALLRVMAETETLARIDPLTGLLNRRSLDSAVRELEADEKDYCVAYGDLDHFKALNDTWGHEAGDQALRLFAELLVQVIRPGDLACRFGGEEFVVVLPECTLDEATSAMDRVRTALADATTALDTPAFTVSFGVASSEQAESFARVVALADSALLRAKAGGRDRVVTAGTAVLGGAPPAIGAGS